MLINDTYDRIVAVIDKNTGEVLEETQLRKHDDVVIKRKQTEEQYNYLINKTQLQEYSTNLGGYVHITYVNNELLFNNTLGVKAPNISRIIYLATYIDYKNRNGNLLMKRCNDYQLEPMNRNDLIECLKLKQRTFLNFYKEVTSKGLLIETDKGYVLNDKYFHKGKLEDDKLDNTKGYSRLYVTTTRKLYLNTKTSEHKNLSYIYQLIPFINRKSNRLCFNPEEQDFERIQELNMLDICKMLCLCEDKSRMLKLKKKLLSFKITVDGEELYLLAHNTTVLNKRKFDYFTVNPKVVWNGNKLSDMKSILLADFSKNK